MKRRVAEKGPSNNPCSQSNIHQIDYTDDNPERLIDNSDLHVLDYSPTLKTLCILCVLEYNLDQSALPREITMDIKTMTMPNRISRPINQAG